MTNQPFFVPALGIALLAIPLILGLVPRNRVYGVRTRKALSSDDLWYRANRFGGWLFLLSGIVYLAFAKAHPMTGAHDPRFTLWLDHLLAFALPLVAAIVITVAYLRKL